MSPAIDASKLSFAYVKDRPVLHEVSLQVAAGEICMVLGPSGSGKSTLLKALKGIITPGAGDLSIFGQSVRLTSGREGRRLQREDIAWIPQNLGLVRSATVLTNVLTGALCRTGAMAGLLGMFSKETRAQALQVLDTLGIAHKAHERVAHLSGGERQRVAIARALMQRPRLVLADEFVSHLDPVTTRDILGVVADIARTGMSFLITSHQVELVAEHADRVVFMRDGRLVHEGAARDFSLDNVVALMHQ
ncbi:MAG: ATP-binding cassette domain-containing protein [Acidobacteria bacterium]|nr:ATP-binding cassette domain-containing protein [Acidobacteriota bacterium]